MRRTLPVFLFLLSSSLFAQTSTNAAAPGATNILDCVRSLRDQNGGPCLEASSLATSGLLFPYPGIDNTFTAPAVVSGGRDNVASGLRSTVGGGDSNIASATSATVGGGNSNTASAFNATVGGGNSNTASATNATVGGGWLNDASVYQATISGGYLNTASASRTTIGGGAYNTASGTRATIGGGANNTASGAFATIGGGYFNTASGPSATISGGLANEASGTYATIGGGYLNDAFGQHSFAAGRRARAIHDGAFVWGDQVNVDKTSSASNQFNVYASGGTRIFSNSAATTGVTLAAGGGTWTMVSDRGAKENFEEVDPQSILDQVASIPITTWNYKTQDGSIRHMGPMAQDFFAAFGLGLGDTTIDTIDPDGVALAAIQGLHAENVALRSRVEELESVREELASLKATVAMMAESD